MQAIDVTRHSRITQQLVPSTTVLSFVCCFQFACKKKFLMTFGTTLIQVKYYVAGGFQVKSECSDSVGNLAIKLRTRYLRMGCQDRCFSPGAEL